MRKTHKSKKGMEWIVDDSTKMGFPTASFGQVVDKVSWERSAPSRRPITPQPAPPALTSPPPLITPLTPARTPPQSLLDCMTYVEEEEYVGCIDKMLREIYRVLKPGTVATAAFMPEPDH